MHAMFTSNFGFRVVEGLQVAEKRCDVMGDLARGERILVSGQWLWNSHFCLDFI